MRQNSGHSHPHSHSRRPRGRHNGSGGGHHHRRSSSSSQNQSAVPLRHQIFDSNGPDVRLRGNAFQLYDKYQALAKDAASAGDKVAAENFNQYAEHYFRIMGLIQEAEQSRMQQSRSDSYGRMDQPAAMPPPADHQMPPAEVINSASEPIVEPMAVSYNGDTEQSAGNAG